MQGRRALGILVVAALFLSGASLALAGGHGCTLKAEACAKETKEYFQTHGWLGIEKEKSEDGTMTVIKVYPGGPAERAGFQVGDKITTINGIALNEANHEKLKAMKQEGMKIGDTVTYEVQRGSEKLTLQAALVKIPEDTLATMIQKHAREEHKVAKN